MSTLSPTPSSLEPLSNLNTANYPPGVYRLASRADPSPILATITDWEWVAGYINGKMVNDKQTFLIAVGEAFLFPEYYGHNWDAFEEMINDLSWLPAAGYLLLYDHVSRFADAQPEAWQIALSIFQRASANWQREGIPLYVLLRHNGRWNRHLPKLVAKATDKKATDKKATDKGLGTDI